MRRMRRYTSTCTSGMLLCSIEYRVSSIKTLEFRV